MTTVKQLIDFLNTIPEDAKIMVMTQGGEDEDTYWSNLNLSEIQLSNIGDDDVRLYLDSN